jgi:hypothetical protein
MSRVRLAGVIALTLTVGIAGVALARGKKKSVRKKGKVVRVERGSAGRGRIPRMCGQIAGDGSLQCWGKAVEPGEIAYVYDENGRVAEVRVDTVTEQKDQCQNITGYALMTTVMKGQIGQYNYNSYSFIDYPGTERTRTLLNNGQIQPPGSKPGESLYAMLDDDGDDTPELITTWFPCDATGQPQAYQQGIYCIAYYQRTGGTQYEELRVDVIQNCY